MRSRRARGFLFLAIPAVVTIAFAARGQPRRAPAGPAAAPSASARTTTQTRKDLNNEDLAKMAEGLLDNTDLIQMGQNLLDDENDAGDGGDDGGDAEADAGAADGSVADASADLAAKEADSGAATPARGGGGGLGRGPGRTPEVLPLKGAEESPLLKLGVPLQAVPAVATVATVGLMAIWPALIKTLTGLFKGFLGAKLKARAKKDKKVDENQRAFHVLGFVIRPIELGSLLVAALVYGLAVSYTFQGRKLQRPFLLSQELLVIAIYFSRSVVRFVYERVFKLTTQYKFWLGGGLLCLGSAYLGNTLGTVGFELEATKTPEDAKRAVKMKAWLLVLAIVMAVGFFFLNRHHPAKIWQSGRAMMSGMALGEILPIAPMPGQKIYQWNKLVWMGLLGIVVPTFILINFIL
jgi:hypothetical protein